MNEINKLKIEHARYKLALERVRCTYGNAARLLAEEALNPPPPTPVTLPEVLHALDRYKAASGDYVAILFNPDESGSILVGVSETIIFKFTALRGAVNFLTNKR